MAWEIWDTESGNMISFGNDLRLCAQLLFAIVRDDTRALRWLGVALYPDNPIRDETVYGVHLQDFIDEHLDDVSKMEIML